MQIQKDKQYLLDHPIRVITFGPFDKFHPGHQAYLQQARRWGDELVTVVARDATVEQVKGHLPRQDEQTRLKTIEQSGLVDQAVLGDERDHYGIFEDFYPHIVCL